MTTEQFFDWFGKIEGIEVLKYDENRIFFSVTDEGLIIKLTKCADKSDNFFSIHSEKEGILFCLHNHNFAKFVEIWENKKSNSEKYGIPDLSLVTVGQMMNELKNRENINFAFVMTEASDTQNILLEGSGNPTYVCGLLTRGLYIANKYAEKDLKYDKS